MRAGHLGGWIRAAARRALLYGAAALLFGGGLVLDGRLRAEAGKGEPGPAFASHAGSLGRRPLYDALIQTGASPREAAGVSRALGRELDLRALSPEDRFRVERSSSGELRHVTLWRGLKRYVVSRGGEGLRVASLEVEPRAHRSRAVGIVKGNVWLSMEAEGVPPQVVARFVDVFRWTMDFLTEPREGDRFAVLWTERRAPDGRVLDRAVLAALYDGAETGRRDAFRHDGDYYDAQGESLERMFLKTPLQFGTVSSHFSKRRFHPVLKRFRHHAGTDYAAPTGTPVSSVAGGVVTFAGRAGGYGNVVRVRHDSVYSTRYAHLSRFARSIRKGARVRQGQTIGYVGATGLATGPHLHFEIARHGRPADFLKLDLPFARSLKGARLAAFRLARDRRRAELEALVASSSARSPRSVQ